MLKPATSLRKDSNVDAFQRTVNIGEIFIGSFFIEHLRWLLLNIIANKTEFISLTR